MEWNENIDRMRNDKLPKVSRNYEHESVRNLGDPKKCQRNEETAKIHKYKIQCLINFLLL